MKDVIVRCFLPRSWIVLFTDPFLSHMGHSWHAAWCVKCLPRRGFPNNGKTTCLLHGSWPLCNEGLFASLAAASCLTITLNTSGLSANHSQSDICKRPGCAYTQKDMLPYKCYSIRKRFTNDAEAYKLNGKQIKEKLKFVIHWDCIPKSFAFISHIHVVKKVFP